MRAASGPAAGLRCQYADLSAWQTSSALMRSLIDQPTMRRLARSMTQATPLAVTRARHAHLPTHPGHAERVAMRIDPGALHRDSFAKYAAAFFDLQVRLGVGQLPRQTGNLGFQLGL